MRERKWLRKKSICQVNSEGEERLCCALGLLAPALPLTPA